MTDSPEHDYTIGHVHGRFQPFHTGHLAYCEWAASECDELLVGITNADPSHVNAEATDPDRDDPRNNPFRYYERYRMITDALAAANLDVPVRVLPFPINRPDLWEYYAPADALYLLRVLEEWHEVKANRLREHGRTVQTVTAERTVSGTRIREAMATGDDMWRTSIPSTVEEMIDDIDGVERVRSLWTE